MQPKERIGITLTGWQVALLDDAIRARLGPILIGPEFTGSDLAAMTKEELRQDCDYLLYRRQIIHWAIQAVAAAIIRAGKMPWPLGVELGPETEEVKARRIAYSGEDRSGLFPDGGNEYGRPRFLVE